MIRDDTDYLPLFLANGVTGMRIMWGFPIGMLALLGWLLASSARGSSRV
jgi:hypothetical protein